MRRVRNWPGRYGNDSAKTSEQASAVSVITFATVRATIGDLDQPVGHRVPDAGAKLWAGVDAGAQLAGGPPGGELWATRCRVGGPLHTGVGEAGFSDQHAVSAAVAVDRGKSPGQELANLRSGGFPHG